MHEGMRIEAIQNGGVPRVPETHGRSQEFFERHRDMFEDYAGHTITVMPAPEGLDTFAFDLNTNTIYLTDKFYEQLGYPEAGTTFATFHEIEHFREKLALLKEKNGVHVFEDYLAKLDARKSATSGAYGVTDNCISDVRQNGAVITRNPIFEDTEKALYRDVQFPEVDFTQGVSKQPLHIQLPYAILNEYRSGRTCIVDPRVRRVIDDLQNFPRPNGGTIDLIALITNPDPHVVPMSKRLALQDTYVWPRVQELLEEDRKEHEGNWKEDESQDAQGDEGGKSDEDGSPKEYNPNEIFKDAYTEARKRVPNAQPIEAQQDALKEWKEENGDPEKRANRELAEKLGVKVEDVKQYKDIARELHKASPDTGESTIDALEDIIRRIISNRLKEKHVPRYPVDEGDELVDPAGWLAEARAGNFEPRVWEDTEIKLKKNTQFGEVEITLICDRSGSMKGEKQREQQRALVLFMEALKRFNDVLDDEEATVEKPLVIRSEVYSFQADTNDRIPVKRMGSALTEKERIMSSAHVSTTPGKSTTDFVPLEVIHQSIGSETENKMREGELKKIVIVFTDGGSDDESRVQQVTHALREKGVVIVGVGITESGEPALRTYAPKAVLAERAEDLPRVLESILRDVLTDV